MKVACVYLDTSVIGGCFDAEFSQWSDALLADIVNGSYLTATSEVVAIEVARAPARVQARYADFLATCSARTLQANDEVITLVDAYLGHRILTEKFRNDMLHIALAAVHGVDILSSWNFRHIVRYDKILKFNAVNIEFGYRAIAIHSPRELTIHGED